LSTSTIDPRIRARRIAVQKEAGHKRLRRVSVGLGVVAALSAIGGITRTPLLDVDHIEVVGAVHTGVDRVAAATGIHRGDALLTVGLGRAARAVAALPWVETVRVRRDWPGTVRVSVVEREPAAAAPVRGGGWVLLDVTGRQLAVQLDTPTGVPLLDVAPVTATLGRVLGAGTAASIDLAASVPNGLRGRLAVLRPAPGGTVEATVRLRDGATARVLLGRPTQVAAKWLALLSILEGADTARVTQIDLRVPAAPALTRR
jgi:cell division protein FtsQ